MAEAHIAGVQAGFGETARIEKHDQRGWRCALAASLKMARKLAVQKETRSRLCRILRQAPKTGHLASCREAYFIVSTIRAICDAHTDRFLHDLEKVERMGYFPSGTAKNLQRAKVIGNPYFELLTKLADACDLATDDPALKKDWRGRPPMVRWALVADALAHEIAQFSPSCIWPLVTELLKPLIENLPSTCRTKNLGETSALSADPEHLRQLVSRYRNDKNLRWKNMKAEFMQTVLTD